MLWISNKYLDDVCSDREHLFCYCEVRWLSKGKMLKEFYDLRQEIADFRATKNKPLAKVNVP
ncbi:unnamed protein product [Gongylonema pulchrum]|uniref:BAH domain-containing protein n=1 Tax=Gongylonema pulchrum TaxID=637853 RepID=A0A183DGN1_9BILA|nr:unnamed protein product [Gongylonema pulchrum]